MTTFPYAHMTPAGVRATHSDSSERIGYICHCGELPIYFFERSHSFRAVVPGALEVIDSAKVDADVAALQACARRIIELEEARGHGRAVACKLETVQRRMATEPPPVPIGLPEHPIPRGSMKILPMENVYTPMGMALYDEATDRFWFMGSTGYGYTELVGFELELIRTALSNILALDTDRKADGVRGTEAVLAWLEGRGYGERPAPRS